MHQSQPKLQSRFIWVFSQWLSLDSPNSMYHDKVQKWYDYQEYPMPGISYILRGSSKINFLLLPLDRFLFNVVSGDRYLCNITGNAIVSKWIILVVAIVRLDFEMIHWIQWIFFREIPLLGIIHTKSTTFDYCFCIHWDGIWNQLKFQLYPT